MSISEGIIEQAALAWFEELGWQFVHGPDIAPDGPNPERADYGTVFLESRLRSALASLNPELPNEALEDAFRRITRPEGPTLESRNRYFHDLLVNGVNVDYRSSGGEIRGTQVRVADFEYPDANDWLAVNQFTVIENNHSRRPCPSEGPCEADPEEARLPARQGRIGDEDGSGTGGAVFGELGGRMIRKARVRRLMVHGIQPRMAMPCFEDQPVQLFLVFAIVTPLLI